VKTACGGGWGRREWNVAVWKATGFCRTERVKPPGCRHGRQKSLLWLPISTKLEAMFSQVYSDNAGPYNLW